MQTMLMRWTGYAYYANEMEPRRTCSDSDVQMLESAYGTLTLMDLNDEVASIYNGLFILNIRQKLLEVT
ncbi:hypothetical protein Bpfe_016694 [Biomphalaria pfeifferi]|uniref:Uncharacterized protein n=1 Tax=Biomphalaria pfeifferi TaxID=112525 RepID=A0AAD8BG58_BIOPF|nr:hypothetical protein Bpfe_016694 [Biomphalaria pfeifferi]